MTSINIPENPNPRVTNCNIKPPSALEQVAHVVYMVTFGWIIELIKAIGAAFASNTENTSMKDRVVSDKPQKHDEKTVNIVNGQVKTTIIPPLPTKEATVKTSTIRSNPVPVKENEIDENEKIRLDCKAKTNYAKVKKQIEDLVKVLNTRKETQGFPTLTQNELEAQKHFLSEHNDFLAKYTFLAKTHEVCWGASTYEDLLKILDSKLEPFTKAENQVVAHHLLAKETLQDIKIKKNVGKVKLLELNKTVEFYEDFLKRHPHIAEHKARRATVLDPTYKDIVRDLRTHVQRLEKPATTK